MTRARDLADSADKDIAGTLTVDGLTVDGTATAKDIVISDVNPTFSLYETDTVDQNTLFDNGGGDLYIQTVDDNGSNKKTRLLLDHATGDISFYDSAGSSQAFHWDAADERLGLGTTSPSRVLHISHPTVGGMKLQATTNNYDAFVEFQTVDNNAFIGLDDSLNLLKINNDAGIGAYNHLVVDTSGNVGIGGSPSAKLDVLGNIPTPAEIRITNSGGTWDTGDEIGRYSFYTTDASSTGARELASIKGINDNSIDGTVQTACALAFHTSPYNTNAIERMRISSSGNVGIGTSAGGSGPQDDLHISSSLATIRLEDSDVTGGASYALITSSSNGNLELSADPDNVRSSTDMRFNVDGTEAARIDSSQNLMVGKIAVGYATDGFEARAGGQVAISDTSQVPLLLNRNGTDDGSIINFYKSGGTVGTIAADNGDLTIGTGDTGLRFLDSSNAIIPRNTNRTQSDDALDLGESSNRFDDIYATNSTIQTSDANEKQQIAALTDAEITAAKAISQLFKTFKWNSSVTENGDAARTHTGVIAQDVEAAMTAAGLDAGDYAFFISGTWWETQTDVPAVEAVDAVYEDVVIPAVLDDDGNEVEAERTEQRTVTEAVEAVAAYTRTDTYDTAEEAPAGATERNRKGIRYPELLSFVGAATEQRLANIETRLAALEA
jgi:hypothetical protein